MTLLSDSSVLSLFPRIAAYNNVTTLSILIGDEEVHCVLQQFLTQCCTFPLSLP